jgi:ADP-ribosyl-[dinitrogen reductase] hydrolase
VNRTTATTLDRARGVMLGLAVGDALGGPVEFLSREEILARHGGPVDTFVGGGWLGLKPGDGTDDTAMALALARSVATMTGFDPSRTLAAYLGWFRTDPTDVGNTIRAVLAAVRDGESSAAATESFHRETGRSAGNGTLMRTAPLALRYLRQPDGRRAAARADSKLTHYDDHAADACAWLCDVVAALIDGVDPGELAAPPSLASEWDRSREDAALSACGPDAGYVGTALSIASAALCTAESFEHGVIWAANLGGDADTNAAIVGALLGARFGADAIPHRWLDGLAARDEASQLAERLVDLALRSGPAAGGAAGQGRDKAVRHPDAKLRAALARFSGRLEDDPEARLAAEAAIAESAAFRHGSMLVSNVPERDMLYVLERDYCEDGIEPERVIDICEQAAILLDPAGARCIGFVVRGLSEFDFEGMANAAVWSGPRFDVPALGIRQGTVGLVAATTRLVLGDLRTPDRVLFDAAVNARDREEALTLWQACLDEGNELARYALGYTQLELGRPREAHDQLKRYSVLVPRNAWAWCYLGQACEQLEDWEGAEYAYRQSLTATEGGSFDTDAAGRLTSLLVRHTQSSSTG